MKTARTRRWTPPTQWPRRQADTATGGELTRSGWRWSWSDVALLLVVAGTIARVWMWARGRALWLDEEMIALNIRGRDLAGLAGKLDDGQHAPVGWLWAEKAVAEVFGTGERALRLLPLVFGIGTIVVAWWIGRRWLGPVGAVALVGACAVGNSLLGYSDQLKQYSSDAFWVLLLVGLAARALETHQQRRLYAFWLLAALACWLSMAAIYVTAGVGAILLVTWWRRIGWRAALLGGAAGLVWLASFSANYAVTLRRTLRDPYLTSAWAGIGYPKATAGLLGMAAWSVRQLDVLVDNPIGIGSAAPWAIWLLVAAGIGVAAWRRLSYGLLLAVPLVTAFMLAIVRVVPLSGRLALWLVPVVLLAAATGLDAAARYGVHLWRTGGRARVLAGGGLMLASVTLAVAALVPAGAGAAATVTTGRELDDRSAIEWLRANRRQGDLVLVFGSAIRAFQWYDFPPTMSPRMVVTAPTGPDCDNRDLAHAAAGHQRVLAYFGVVFSPYHQGAEVLAARLAELGPVHEQRFGSLSVVYIVDVTATSSHTGQPSILSGIHYNCVRVLS